MHTLLNAVWAAICNVQLLHCPQAELPFDMLEFIISGSIEIGCSIARAFWENGYAGAAVKALVSLLQA